MDSDVLGFPEAFEEQLQKFEKDQIIALREQLKAFRTAVQRVVELHEDGVLKLLQEENRDLDLKFAHRNSPKHSPLRLSARPRNVSATPIESPAMIRQGAKCSAIPLIKHGSGSSELPVMSHETSGVDNASTINSKRSVMNQGGATSELPLISQESTTVDNAGSIISKRSSADKFALPPLPIGGRSPAAYPERRVSFHMGSSGVTSFNPRHHIRDADKEESNLEWTSIAKEWDTGWAPSISMCPPRPEVPSVTKNEDLKPEICTLSIQQPLECPAMEKPSDLPVADFNNSSCSAVSPHLPRKVGKIIEASIPEESIAMTCLITSNSNLAIAGADGQSSAPSDFSGKRTCTGSELMHQGTKLERLEVAMNRVKRLTAAPLVGERSRDTSLASPSHPGSSPSQAVTTARQNFARQICGVPLPADGFYLVPMWREHLSCVLSRMHDSSFDPSVTQSTAGLLYRGDPHSASHTSEAVSKTVATYMVAGAQRLVLSPCCGKRLWWDVISMVLTIYDLMVIPLGAFDFQENDFSSFMFWFTIVFWTLDIVLSFFTGVQTTQGMEMRLGHIAGLYAKSWLGIDMVIIAPEWILLFADQAADRENTGVNRLGKLLKLVRFVRSIRLLRIFRFTRALSGIQDRLKSELILNLVDFGKLVGGLAFLNHYLSCFWFFMGKLQDDGWVDKYSMRSVDKHYQYLTSLHWSISQFHGTMEVNPQTSWERLVAIATAFLGLILASLFISSITNLIMRMQKLHQETFLKTRKLLRYLNENRISQNLTWRIKRFTRLTANAQVMRLQDVELLNTLPAHLLEEIMVETKAPGLQINMVLKHCILRVPQTKKQLCQEVLSEAEVKSGGLVFGHTERSGKMFLILKGKVLYHPNTWAANATRSFPVADAVGSKDTVQSNKFMSSSTTCQTKSDSFPGSMLPITSKFFPRRTFKSATMFLKRNKAPDVQDPMECEIKVAAGQFIAEMNLWTHWAHRGDCVVSGCATIFSVDAAALGKVMMNDMNHSVELALDIANYATQYVDWLNAFGITNHRELHDCACPPDLSMDNTQSRFAVGKTTSIPTRVADRLAGFIRRSIQRGSFDSVKDRQSRGSLAQSSL